MPPVASAVSRVSNIIFLGGARCLYFGKKPHTAKSTPQEPLFCVDVTLANAGPMDKRLTGGGGLGGRKGG